MTLYEYDVFDRLIKIEQGDDVIENTYTADGKKFSRSINALLVYYVYDGDVVLEERTFVNAEMARNVYGRNLIFRETRADSGYYSYNGHGDVVRWEYTNRNGYVEYEYDEFGQVSSYEYDISTMAPVMAPTVDTTDEVSPKELGYVCNPYRYAGYEYLEQIGIYDLNARYYNPEIARFLSADPYYNLGNRVIGLYEVNVPNAASIMQANNLYVYCGNSPIGFVDQSGESLTAGIAAIVVIAMTFFGVSSCESTQNNNGSSYVTSIDSLPQNVQNSYYGYSSNGWNGNYSGQTPGTRAGGSWSNRNGLLPTTDSFGSPITYQEFDVNNKIEGKERDKERFLVGSDGSIYYTWDHYTSFKKIR